MSATNCEGAEASTTGETSQFNSVSRTGANIDNDPLMKTAQFATVATAKQPGPGSIRHDNTASSRPNHISQIVREFSPRLERREQEVVSMMNQIVSKARNLPSQGQEQTRFSPPREHLIRPNFGLPLKTKADSVSDETKARMRNSGSLNGSKDGSYYFTLQGKQQVFKNGSSQTPMLATPSENFRIRASNSKRAPGADTSSGRYEKMGERLRTDPGVPTLRLFEGASSLFTQSSKYIKKVQAPAFNQSQREDDKQSVYHNYIRHWASSGAYPPVSTGTEATRQGSSAHVNNLSAREQYSSKKREQNSSAFQSAQKPKNRYTDLSGTQEKHPQQRYPNQGATMPSSGHYMDTHKFYSARAGGSSDDDPSLPGPRDLGDSIRSPANQTNRTSGQEVPRLRPKVSFDKLLLGRQRSGHSPPNSASAHDQERSVKMSILINRPKLQSQGISQRDEELLHSLPLGMTRKMDRKFIGSEIITSMPVKALRPQFEDQGAVPLLNTFLSRDPMSHMKKNSTDTKPAVRTGTGPSTRPAPSNPETPDNDMFMGISGTRLAKQQHRVMSMLFGQKGV